MFDMDWQVTARRVCDGLSNTIMVGEATYGPAWLLSDATARNPPNAISYPAPSYQLVDLRSHPLDPDRYGHQRIAWQPWAGPVPSFWEFFEYEYHNCTGLACNR
jgi:hypothetical protein